MAPNAESPAAMTAVAPFLATIIGSFGGEHSRWQRTPSSHELRTYIAGDLHSHKEELELMLSPAADNNGGGHDTAAAARSSSSALEVEEAECESCGMSEECTAPYIAGVRRRFSGRWVCGLCAEAVAEEAGKNGGDRDAALAAHTAVCRRFNGFGRTHPALFQAHAVIGIVRKLSAAGSSSPRSSPTTTKSSPAAGAKSAVDGSAGCLGLVAAGVRNGQVVTN